MKKSIHKENLEKLHYNNFADHKTLRDTYLPSINTKSIFKSLGILKSLILET